jgi:hypothetical protein
MAGRQGSGTDVVIEQVSEAPAPSESERVAFVARLAAFRHSLREIEQEMLDALVGAAIVGHDAQDVARYWISPRADPPGVVDSTETEAQ